MHHPCAQRTVGSIGLVLLKRSSTFIVLIAAVLLVVLAACGGESNPTLSPTATPTPSPTSSPTDTLPSNELTREQQEACVVEAIGEQVGRELFNGERQPSSDELDALAGCGIRWPGSEDYSDTLTEATAPAELGSVAWPEDAQENSDLFGRLPSKIAGHGIKSRFDQVGEGRFDTTYGEDPQTHDHVLMAMVQDLTLQDFFPPSTNAGQYVAMFAQGFDWEVLAAGREGDLAWVQIKTTGTDGEVTRDVYGMFWGIAPSSLVFGAQAGDLGDLIAIVEAMVSVARK